MKSGRPAAASASFFVLMMATMLASDAQTWHWTYVTRTPNTPLLVAQSTVSVASSAVRIAYTVPLQNRQVVVESCKSDLRDIQRATTIRTQRTTYLLIRFKPSHSAACVSGKRPAVALPTDDYRYVSSVAAAINRSCCSDTRGAAPRPRPPAVVAAASPAPSPAQTPAAGPSPAPGPAQTPAAVPPPAPSPAQTPAAGPSPAPPRVQDWVENEGLFTFVRIRNVGHATIALAGEVFDCRNADSGCGPFAGGLQVKAGSTITVATITSKDRHGMPALRYRYTASDGTQTTSAAGSSSKTAPPNVARMSAQELRTAQADAIGGMRPAPRSTSAPIVPARLVKRGSSRLAIGQTGTALIRLTIAANGTPQEATIVSISNKQLSAAAIETAVSSTYAAAMQNGHAFAAKYVATFTFDGEDPALATVPVWKRAPSPSVSPTLPAPASTAPSPSPTPPTPPTPPAALPSTGLTSAAPATLPSPRLTPAAPATPLPSASPTTAAPATPLPSAGPTTAAPATRLPSTGLTPVAPATPLPSASPTPAAPATLRSPGLTPATPATTSPLAQ